MGYEAFRENTGINIDEIKHIDIRYIIKSSLQRLKLSESRLAIVSYPMIPTLINIALATKKGCGPYYRLLSKKRYLENNIGKRDEKWHAELDSVLSVTFWDNVRHLNSTIDFDNPNKWLQFQIIRNCLQTNYIVSHFIRNVSPLCQYCGFSNEKISHIFWFCSIVNIFLNETFEYISSTGLAYFPSKLEFLFGVPEVTFDHPKNYLSLLIKRYIWKVKFGSAILNIVGLKYHLKACLCDLKNIYEKKDEAIKFNDWILLYNDLCQVDQNAVQPFQAPGSPL